MDDRNYLKEAFEYARGVRRYSHPSIEHVQALAKAYEAERALRREAVALAESLRQSIDVRDELLTELLHIGIVPPMAAGSDARN